MSKHKPSAKRKAMRAEKAKARNLFNKINALNSITKGDDKVGANAERKAMRQRWVNRDMRPGNFHKRSNAKPSHAIITQH